MREREGKKLRENMARKAEIQKREKEREGRNKDREERGRREKVRLSPPLLQENKVWAGLFQGVTKRCRLSLLTNSALVYES
jgi:hypothetical protein